MGRRFEHRALFHLLLFVACFTSATASAQYQQGRLIAIEKHTIITPIDYIYDVVVSYYETVTYELEIEQGDEIYYTKYTPEVQPNWPLPSEWKLNQPIQFRRDQHRLLVRLEHNGELVTYISGHSRNRSH
jgi:hypothetical protein